VSPGNEGPEWRPPTGMFGRPMVYALMAACFVLSGLSWIPNWSASKGPPGTVSSWSGGVADTMPSSGLAEIDLGAAVASRESEATASGYKPLLGWSDSVVSAGDTAVVEITAVRGLTYAVLARTAADCDVDIVINETLKDTSPGADATLQFEVDRNLAVPLYFPVDSRTRTVCPLGFGVYRQLVRSAQRAPAAPRTGAATDQLRRAQNALLHNRLDDAIVAADRVLATNADSPRARAIKSNALFERYWVRHDESDQAQGRAIVAALENSQDAAGYTARGNLSLISGDTATAIGLLGRAVASDPNDAYARNQLGFALMVAGRSDEGLTHLRRALQLMPDMAWVKTNLLDAMVALGHCDETISGLRRDALADCNNRVGIIHSQAQRFAEASRHFGRAAELVPTTGMYHANLAAALLQMGDRQSAVLHAEEARKLGVTDHWVFGALSRP